MRSHRCALTAVPPISAPPILIMAIETCPLATSSFPAAANTQWGHPEAESPRLHVSEPPVGRSRAVDTEHRLTLPLQRLGGVLRLTLSVLVLGLLDTVEVNAGTRGVATARSGSVWS
jgi:hypothetical protein